MVRKSNNTALNILCSNQNTGLLDNQLSKSVTFVAATTGAVGTFKIVGITGTVALSIFGICTVNSAGTGTIEVGTALSTAGLIAQVNCNAFTAGEIWHDNSPDSSIELTSVITKNIVTQDVAHKITTNTMSAGAITFYILWSPISPDGLVELA